MVRIIQPEVYSRVTGYFRPVSQFNRGKQEEFKDRYKRNPKEVIDCLNQTIIKT